MMSAMIVRLIMEADEAGQSPKQFFTDLMAKTPDEAFDRLEDWRVRDFGDASQTAKGILRQIFSDDIPIKAGWEQLSREAADTGIITDLIGSVYKAVSKNRPEATMGQAKAIIKGITPTGVKKQPGVFQPPYWAEPSEKDMVAPDIDAPDIDEFEKEHTRRLEKEGDDIVDIEPDMPEITTPKKAPKKAVPKKAPKRAWRGGRRGSVPTKTKKKQDMAALEKAKAKAKAPTKKPTPAKPTAKSSEEMGVIGGMNIPSHLQDILDSAKGKEKPKSESRAPMVQRIDEALEDITGHLEKTKKSFPLFLGKGLRSFRGEAEQAPKKGAKEAALRQKAGMPERDARRPGVKRRIEMLKQREKASRLKKQRPQQRAQGKPEKEEKPQPGIGTDIQVGFEEAPVDVVGMIKKTIMNDIEAQMLGDHPDLKKLIKKQVIRHAKVKGLAEADIDVDQVTQELYSGI